jgi:hypothetical protein
MSVVIKIKRRLSGDASPPDNLESGELAYNEVDDTLYIGVSQPNTEIKNSLNSNIILSGS